MIAKTGRGLMRWPFRRFALIFLALTLASSHRAADARDRIHDEIARLQGTASTEQSSCDAIYEFAGLFHRMSEAERLAIDEGLIAEMSALLDQYSALPNEGCMSYVMADIFGKLGPRAKVAVPALERALKAAELARAESYERSRTFADCLMLGMNFDRKADHVLRLALWYIDGRERKAGYTVNCPLDDAPPG